jgi:glucose/arabinose dehydrogenase
MRLLLLFALMCSAALLGAQSVVLTQVATGFSEPTDIAHAGDGRLFIVEKAGRIKILDPATGATLPTAFLDIAARVGDNGSEQGLLGLAFHPDYAVNGYFFVNYTNTSGDTRVSRFSRTANNPNLADANSELVLLAIDQPYSNHNGGCIKFGPDGYLYVGMGDGGSAGDPQNLSQNPTSLLGKMLRLDVDNGSPYGIPPTNPFVSDPNTADEIWAVGLRNPWRFSFDRQTGDLWMGDVGQNQWEEIDLQPAASTGGENYGWRCYEGNVAYNNNGCGPVGNYVAPVYVYAHINSNCSVTGGFVYRGSQEANLSGMYIYCDYCTGIFWGLKPGDAPNTWANVQLGNFANYNFAAYGEDAAGELYAAGLSDGVIYRVRDFCSLNPAAVPTVNVNGNVLTTTSPGPEFLWLLDGQPIAGATGTTYTATATGTYSLQITNTNGCTAVSDTVFLDFTGVPATEEPELSAVFPNPTEGRLEVRLSAQTAPDAVLRASDALGRTVFQTALAGQSVLTLDASGWPAGMYQVEVRSSRGVSVLRVVKR